MNVLIVLAHPEENSLNAALANYAMTVLAELGHSVRNCDLYAMGWKACADGDDFSQRANHDRLNYADESRAAFLGGWQSPEVTEAQELLLWSDAVIFQFPLWWFSMPAILKGWFDRVYASGFAYRVGQQGRDRYGNGRLRGKRAMISLTVGGRAPLYSDRGINGAMDDLLFPIHHGLLFYTGMNVLPAHVVYQAARLPEDQWAVISAAYRARLQSLFIEPPIPFRTENSGYYDADQRLFPGLGHDVSGPGIHVKRADDPAPSPIPPSYPERSQL